MEVAKPCKVCESKHAMPHAPCSELINLEQTLDQLVLQAKIQKNERNKERIQMHLDQTRLIIQTLKEHERKEGAGTAAPKLIFQKQSQTPLQRKIDELISRAEVGETLWMTLTAKPTSKVELKQ